MEITQFEKLVDEVLVEIRNTLISKGKEYATKDVLSNFKQSSGFFTNGTPKLALYSFLVKHLVSIKNHCDDTVSLDYDKLLEKCKDNICYSLLLLALKQEEDELIKTNI